MMGTFFWMLRGPDGRCYAEMRACITQSIKNLDAMFRFTIR